MKVYASICAMVLLLHLAMGTQDSAQVRTAPRSCCFTYMPMKIPRRHVADYYRTGKECSQPAIVFITTRGREMCADPTAEWVQDYVSHLEQN